VEGEDVMREIKFRGKRKDNGEWIYGSFVRLDYHNSVDYVEAHQIVLENGHSFEVDPETIGEFSGLKDKNGVEIFEGDVVSIPTTNDQGEMLQKREIVSVFWHDKEMRFAVSYYGISLCGFRDDIEVIGNIFENKDLLK
jgi:uncharacterized phage protein (TIGR01671 family)